MKDNLIMICLCSYLDGIIFNCNILDKVRTTKCGKRGFYEENCFKMESFKDKR